MKYLKRSNPNSWVFLMLGLFTIISRVFPHLANFTPLGAMVLFGCAYVKEKKKNYLMPIVALFLSDILIQGIIYQGNYGFPLYDGWYWVYSGTLLMVFFGRKILNVVSVTRIGYASIVVSFAYWLITNFGVWITGGIDVTSLLPFTKDIQGLIRAYVVAVPFLENFLVSTLVYSYILFGVFELFRKRFLDNLFFIGQYIRKYHG